KTRSSKAARSVVLIELIASDGLGKSFCTATLVGPHTILTAGHCFDSNVLRDFANFRVLFTNSYSDAFFAESRPGIYFKKHPQYNSEKKYDHDIALGIFSGNIPAGYNVVAMDDDITANYANAKTYVYGYGQTIDYSGKPSEDLRHSIGDLHKGILQINSNYEQSQDRYYVLAETPNHICYGDSGGPQFYNKDGALKVIGVNSAVGGERLSNGNRRCTSWSQATKVAPAYEWFKKEERKGLRML
ncbi:MAG: S1 family peptidase, partial [Bacillota bacterium]